MSETTPFNRCPTCGENRTDRLVFHDDIELDCLTCGHTYPFSWPPCPHNVVHPAFFDMINTMHALVQAGALTECHDEHLKRTRIGVHVCPVRGAVQTVNERVKYIRVDYSEDSLFEDWDTERIDFEESTRRYRSLVREEIKRNYPGLTEMSIHQYSSDRIWVNGVQDPDEGAVIRALLDDIWNSGRWLVFTDATEDL